MVERTGSGLGDQYLIALSKSPSHPTCAASVAPVFVEPAKADEEQTEPAQVESQQKKLDETTEESTTCMDLQAKTPGSAKSGKKKKGSKKRRQSSQRRRLLSVVQKEVPE